MSAEWEVGPALAIAYLHAAIERADFGVGASRLRLYTTARPASVTDAHADTAQAEIVLAKPCGRIDGEVLILTPAVAGGAMVQAAGMPRWAEWVAADGAVLTRCWVTDADHDGGIRVLGGATPAGETSPVLYAGGLVRLDVVALT